MYFLLFIFRLHCSTLLYFYVIMPVSGPVAHLCHNVQSTSFVTSSIGGHFFGICMDPRVFLDCYWIDLLLHLSLNLEPFIAPTTDFPKKQDNKVHKGKYMNVLRSLQVKPRRPAQLRLPGISCREDRRGAQQLFIEICGRHGERCVLGQQHSTDGKQRLEHNTVQSVRLAARLAQQVLIIISARCHSEHFSD